RRNGMPIIIETYHEFEQRQKCEAIFVHNRWLFANGAQSDEHSHADPPTNPQERKRLRFEFLTAKHANLLSKYNHDRDAILEQAQYHAMGAGPMPPDGWEEHLKGLASQIENVQRR